MATVEVSLLSGRSVRLEANLAVTVGAFRDRSRHALAAERGRLLFQGSYLMSTHTLAEAGISDGSQLQLVAMPVQVVGAEKAFAAIRGDGSVVAWGDPENGGDASAVQDQLQDVVQVQNTSYAFAALRSDGSVVTWGDPESGADSSFVQHELHDVRCIQGGVTVFVAIRTDGTAVTWGEGAFGGDSRGVRDALTDVLHVQINQGSCCGVAAISNDDGGSIAAWGDPINFGQIATPHRPIALQCTDEAFAAILADGSVMTFGRDYFGGDSSLAFFWLALTTLTFCAFVQTIIINSLKVIFQECSNVSLFRGVLV